MEKRKVITPLALLIVISVAMLAAPASGFSAVTPSNVTISFSAKLNITAFNATPSALYLGQSLSFYVTAFNTGNLNVTNFTVEVNTSWPSGVDSQQRDYAGVTVPVQNVTVIIADYTPSSTGSHNSTAIAYYNGTLGTNRLHFNFTVLPAPTAEPTPTPAPVVGGAGGGGGGGGGGAIGGDAGVTYVIVPPKKVQPVPPAISTPNGSSEFVGFPVIFESYLNETKLMTFTVRNPWPRPITNIIKITGLPPEWLATSSASVFLNPGDSKNVVVAIEVPRDAFAGYYELKFKIGENAVVLPVRLKYPDPSQPTVTRNVYLEYAAGRTAVSLTVRNNGPMRKTVEIIEAVPKSLAASAKQLSFPDGTPEILEDDPVLLWRLTLEPKETARVSYNVPAIPKDFSVFTNVKVLQLNVIREQLLDRIRVLNMTVPRLFPGRTSQFFFQLRNGGDGPVNLNLSLDVPGETGWKIEPARVALRLEPGETKPVRLRVLAPLGASFGTHPATLTVVSDDGWLEKIPMSFTLGPALLFENIDSFLSALGPVGILGTILLLVGGIVLFMRTRNMRGEMHRIHEMRLENSSVFSRPIIRDREKADKDYYAGRDDLYKEGVK